MRLELPRLLGQQNATVIYVTQDYKEAMALGHRIAVIKDGAIQQIGTPAEIYLTPASTEIAPVRRPGHQPAGRAPRTARGRGGRPHLGTAAAAGPGLRGPRRQRLRAGRAPGIDPLRACGTLAPSPSRSRPKRP